MKKKIINNIKIKPLPTDEIKDSRPCKGWKIFLDDLYPNLSMIAKKKSGKTVALGNIVKLCCDDRTIVIVFSPNIYSDNSHIGLRDHCEKKGIEYHGYTSIIDENGNNIIKILENQLREQAKQRMIDSKIINKMSIKDLQDYMFENDDGEDKEKKKEYKVPEYCVIIDDLRSEIKSSVVRSMIQMNRHYHIMCIISSQYSKDLMPASRENIDSCIVFKKQPDKRIQQLCDDFDLEKPIDDLIEIYKDATKEDYSFLFIDIRNEKYRKKLDTEYC
tara:strand:- start:3034 stop:3855 length:822 start_codon:yes stop_codon:yes gene_type:complete